MKENFGQEYLSEQEIQKERTISDAELLERGAKYNKDMILTPTEEQIKTFEKTHIKEVAETLKKVQTDYILSYNGTDKRILFTKKLVKGGSALGPQENEDFEGKIDNDHAKYIIDKISGRVILEITEQQRLELSGNNEGVKDSIKRLMDNIKELKLKRGDVIELQLRDNTTRTGYFDDEDRGISESSVFNWNSNKKKAYFPLGGWINEGEFSFGIRGYGFIPVQAIERIILVEKRGGRA